MLDTGPSRRGMRQQLQNEDRGHWAKPAISGGYFLTQVGQAAPLTFVPHAQSGNERLLRDRDVAIFPHLGFALLLLLEQLAFAGRVAAIAFGGDVLPQGRDGLIGPAGGSKLLKTLINLRG